MRTITLLALAACESCGTYVYKPPNDADSQSNESSGSSESER